MFATATFFTLLHARDPALQRRLERIQQRIGRLDRDARFFGGNWQIPGLDQIVEQVQDFNPQDIPDPFGIIPDDMTSLPTELPNFDPQNIPDPFDLIPDDADELGDLVPTWPDFNPQNIPDPFGIIPDDLTSLSSIPDSVTDIFNEIKDMLPSGSEIRAMLENPKAIQELLDNPELMETLLDTMRDLGGDVMENMQDFNPQDIPDPFNLIPDDADEFGDLIPDMSDLQGLLDQLPEDVKDMFDPETIQELLNNPDLMMELMDGLQDLGGDVMENIRDFNPQDIPDPLNLIPDDADEFGDLIPDLADMPSPEDLLDMLPENVREIVNDHLELLEDPAALMELLQDPLGLIEQHVPDSLRDLLPGELPSEGQLVRMLFGMLMDHIDDADGMSMDMLTHIFESITVHADEIPHLQEILEAIGDKLGMNNGEETPGRPPVPAPPVGTQAPELPVVDGAPAQPPARVCCFALTSTCLACAENMTEEEYCNANPNTVGCDKFQQPNIPEISIPELNWPEWPSQIPQMPNNLQNMWGRRRAE